MVVCKKSEFSVVLVLYISGYLCISVYMPQVLLPVVLVRLMLWLHVHPVFQQTSQPACFIVSVLPLSYEDGKNIKNRGSHAAEKDVNVGAKRLPGLANILCFDFKLFYEEKENEE